MKAYLIIFIIFICVAIVAAGLAVGLRSPSKTLNVKRYTDKNCTKSADANKEDDLDLPFGKCTKVGPKHYAKVTGSCNKTVTIQRFSDAMCSTKSGDTTELSQEQLTSCSVSPFALPAETDADYFRYSCK